MFDEFQKLDALIIENVDLPARIKLRNQLARALAQVEAYLAAVDQQNAAMATQQQAIAKLQQEKAFLEQKLLDARAFDRVKTNASLEQIMARQRVIRRNYKRTNGA